MEITDPLHAYIPFQLAVNSSQARIDCKDRILLTFEQILQTISLHVMDIHAVNIFNRINISNNKES